MEPWALPESVEVGGRELAVRSDFRAVLDVISVMADPDLDQQEKAAIALQIFYPDFDEVPPADWEEAARKMSWFVDGGREREGGPKPRLMDWEQDFALIISPVNRVLGYEARERDHVHWWTFLSAYMEIGECLFANVVSVRRKKARGKMDKGDREFYRRNRAIVDLKARGTGAGGALADEWLES